MGPILFDESGDASPIDMQTQFSHLLEVKTFR